MNASLAQLRGRCDEVLRLAQRHGARRLRVFGSAARDTARPDSDIDLLVEMNEDRSLLDRIALMRDLEELLGRPVDVVNERALHDLIRDPIIAQAVEL